jgi:hypothetical protein
MLAVVNVKKIARHDPEPQPFPQRPERQPVTADEPDLEVDRTRHARSEHIRFASDRDTNLSKPMNMIDSQE